MNPAPRFSSAAGPLRRVVLQGPAEQGHDEDVEEDAFPGKSGPSPPKKRV